MVTAFPANRTAVISAVRRSATLAGAPGAANSRAGQMGAARQLLKRPASRAALIPSIRAPALLAATVRRDFPNNGISLVVSQFETNETSQSCHRECFVFLYT